MAIYELDGVKVRTPGPGRYYVADSAVVVGNVEIGDDVSIWFNTVVRGDNDLIRIRNGANIQDGCVLHVDPGFPIDIGENTAIGHMVMLHGCTVGAGCLIGMGAIVMNGAVVGDQCLVGAGTLISEGKIIPPRSMVLGSPGKVIRELSDDEVARLARGPENYKRNWRKFASSMRLQTEDGQPS
jgi:carbonic anhydrase/acetyltransferase-like protein (isoleucine patch superfamily)